MGAEWTADVVLVVTMWMRGGEFVSRHRGLVVALLVQGKRAKGKGGLDVTCIRPNRFRKKFEDLNRPITYTQCLTVPGPALISKELAHLGLLWRAESVRKRVSLPLTSWTLDSTPLFAVPCSACPTATRTSPEQPNKQHRSCRTSGKHWAMSGVHRSRPDD